MDKKNLRLIVGISACVAALLFVFLLVIGILYDGGAFAKTLMIILSVSVLALSLELGYLYFLSANTRPNYFLYNPSTNRNISSKKLTFQLIDTRMNKYLTNFAESEGKIWIDGVFDSPVEMDDAFKPLVCYKLLFDLAARDSEIGWRCFEMSSDATVRFIAGGISAAGDVDMAKRLVKLKETTPQNIKAARDFIVKNRRYIQGKMYKYTVSNISKF